MCPLSTALDCLHWRCPAGYFHRLRVLPARRGCHRDRPVIGVIAENSGTELVDFVVPYGVLARSGVAEIIAVATRDGADYVVMPFIVQRKNPVLLGWIKAQADKGSTMVSICDGAMVLAEAGLLQQRRDQYGTADVIGDRRGHCGPRRRGNAGRYVGHSRLEPRA